MAHKEHWDYQFIILILNCLVNCTHPEMLYAVYQCARFYNDPKHAHKQAVKRIIRYLLNTKRNTKGNVRGYHGILYRPDKTRSIDTYVDASLSREWNTSRSDEPASVIFRTGYIMLYANCPVIWYSRLQIEIDLSTTESEYIALSQSLREVIPLME